MKRLTWRQSSITTTNMRDYPDLPATTPLDDRHHESANRRKVFREQPGMRSVAAWIGDNVGKAVIAALLTAAGRSGWFYPPVVRSRAHAHRRSTPTGLSPDRQASASSSDEEAGTPSSLTITYS